MRIRGLAGLLIAMGCGAVAAADLPAPKVAQRTPSSVAELGITAKLAVDRIKTTLLAGDDIGHVSQGLLCGSRKPVQVSADFLKNFGSLETSVATQGLKRLGYPMAGAGSSTPYSTDVSAAPDFRLGGIVREMKLEACRSGNDAKGWVYVKIDWALFAEREQKVVFQRTTEGGSTQDNMAR